MQMTYPLAPDGVFLTVQGEGSLMGMPMVFVRLAGCSVGCDHCDTDYSVKERADPQEIALRAIDVSKGCNWVWITGGEPLDHDLTYLIRSLRRAGFRIALATSGIKEVKMGFAYQGVDFLSVSPHDPSKWVKRSGDQLNLVPGLNGFSLKDFLPALEECEGRFTHKYVTPLWYPPGSRMEGVEECVEWVKKHPDWKLGIQAHHFWNIK